MSWQAYVDDHLVRKGLAAASIFGKDEGGIWAKSAGFLVTEAEGNNLIDLFNGGSEVSLGGESYSVNQAEDHMVTGKNDNGGFVAMITTQAVVLGVYKGSGREEAISTVAHLVNYLIGNGY